MMFTRRKFLKVTSFCGIASVLPLPKEIYGNSIPLEEFRFYWYKYVPIRKHLAANLGPLAKNIKARFVTPLDKKESPYTEFSYLKTPLGVISTSNLEEMLLHNHGPMAINGLDEILGDEIRIALKRRGII